MHRIFSLTVVSEGELWPTCAAEHVEDFLSLGFETAAARHNVSFSLIASLEMYVLRQIGPTSS